MENKERLERATLMAMQGILANPKNHNKPKMRISLESLNQAVDVLCQVDIECDNYLKEHNQETQETQEPKRGDVVWVRDNDNQEWSIGYYKCFVNNKYSVALTFVNADSTYWNQMTTKNPYTDGK